MGSTVDATHSTNLPPGYRGLRGQTLLELKRSATGLTARDLVERLGVSLNTVRHHLRELESAGLLERRREVRGVGAPVHRYFLNAAGEGLFPRRYEELLTETLSRVEGRSGRPAVVEAMEQHYGLLASRLREELDGTTGHDRLERVARILGEEGYMASWQSADGSIRLTEHNCAIKAVAERFPQICELEERFLREVLVAGVERHSHILTGCQACEYSIHFPERGSEGDPAPPGITRNDEK